MSDSNSTYINYINGKWCEGSTGDWDSNRNPACPSEIIGKATRSTTQDLDTAIEAAVLAQMEWAKTPRPIRGALLNRVAKIIREKQEQLAQILTREEGKNITEAKGEVLKSANALEFTAAEGRRPVGEVIPSEMPNTFLYTTRTPLGVAGIITPWNFPLCIPAWKIGPALLEGNSVIFKPATLTPASAFELVKAFEQAGIPPGVLNLVYGSGSTIGKALVQDKRVRAISFTGSNEIGTELNVLAAKRLARVQLEMGGKNPVIVLADCNLDNAADAIVQGAFGSTGQRCTATSRVIVEKKCHGELKDKILQRIRKIKVGDGLLDPQAMGPVIDEKQFSTVLAAIHRAKQEGAELLCGGERVGTDHPDSGYFIAPTVFDQVKPSMAIAREEIFGPVLAILPVSDFEEAITVGNAVEFGLTSSVYTNDVGRVMRYADRIETGMLHVNSPTVGGEVQAPFGGVKSTGLGRREMGSAGPEFFCEIKTIYVDYNSSTRQSNLY
jgi:acyl-CoA reductase-like NAD-dependent aldehyde dehydrogenase